MAGNSRNRTFGPDYGNLQATDNKEAPFLLTEGTQDGLRTYLSQLGSLMTGQSNVREYLRQIDLIYQREVNLTAEQSRAKASNRYGDPTKYQDIIVPVVAPAIETAVGYQADVFCSGEPLFPVVADPQFVDAGLQLEANLDDQAIRGGWARHFIMAFRDAFKYNMAFIDLDWAIQKVPYVSTDGNTGAAKIQQTIWAGNVVERWDPYNTFWDTRVPISELSTRGEFAGTIKVMSRVELMVFLNSLPYNFNVKKALESGPTPASDGASDSAIQQYYVPSVNPQALINMNPRNQQINWLSWAGMSGAQNNSAIQYKNIFEVTKLYARIIPNDFNIAIPNRNHPQIWKFYFVNGQILVYAERLTNMHNRLPAFGISPIEDGLTYQTKSLATNSEPFQSVTSAMLASVIAARRKAISDRTIYDPSRISERHMNSDNPSAKIPLRPAGYGKNPAESVYAFPFRDDNSIEILNSLPFFMSLNDKLTGSNPARQGQFVKGNKSRKEFEDVQAASANPDKLAAIFFETQFFTPFKETAKLNILQYQNATSVYSRAQKRDVKIDPVALRKASLQFKVADGERPASKIMNDDSWQVTIQTAFSSPEVAAEFNIGPMFTYLMKSRGADISPFEKSPQQKAYEQAMGAWNNAAALAAKAGTAFNTPQPDPKQFNYTPGAPTTPPITPA